MNIIRGLNTDLTRVVSIFIYSVQVNTTLLVETFIPDNRTVEYKLKLNDQICRRILCIYTIYLAYLNRYKVKAQHVITNTIASNVV